MDEDILALKEENDLFAQQMEDKDKEIDELGYLLEEESRNSKNLRIENKELHDLIAKLRAELDNSGSLIKIKNLERDIEELKRKLEHSLRENDELSDVKNSLEIRVHQPMQQL